MRLIMHDYGIWKLLIAQCVSCSYSNIQCAIYEPISHTCYGTSPKVIDRCTYVWTITKINSTYSAMMIEGQPGPLDDALKVILDLSMMHRRSAWTCR